jgi:hypothetical protein
LVGIALASLESSVSMTISSCLYPNRSVVREIPVVLAMTRRRDQRGDEGDEGEERERMVEEEGREEEGGEKEGTYQSKIA